MNDFLKSFYARFSGPYYGFVSVTILFFNWHSIALLFMSKDPVETRIATIQSSFEWWPDFCIPLLIGFFGAVLSPYLTTGIEWTHRLAEIFSENAQTNRERRELDKRKELGTKKAIADTAESLERTRRDIRQSILNARSAKIDTGIIELKEEARHLRATHIGNIKKFRMLSEEINNIFDLLEAMDKWAEEAGAELPDNENIHEMIRLRREFYMANSRINGASHLPDLTPLFLNDRESQHVNEND